VADEYPDNSNLQDQELLPCSTWSPLRICRKEICTSYNSALALELRATVPTHPIPMSSTLPEVAMASNDTTDYSDLAQVAEPARKVQDLIESLAAYFDIMSIPEKEGYTNVECIYDESTVLNEVRDEFKKEPARSKKVSRCLDYSYTC
jgi:hypothetical protein